MKSRVVVSVGCLCGSALFAMTAAAGSATWNLDANGNWNANASWLPNTTYPNGVGQVAALTNNITAARTVNLNNQTITLGTLLIGDNNNTHNFTLSGGGTLVFDVASGSAQIKKMYRTGGDDTISSAIQLNDPMIISNLVGANLVISGAIRGNQPISLGGTGASGLGSVTLSGNNLFSMGDVFAQSGARVIVGNAFALGQGALTIDSGAGLYVNAAIVITNAITVQGNGWLESSGTLGALRLNGNAVLAGPITLAGDTRISAYSANSGTISGDISGAFDLDLNENGSGNAGTIILTGNNSYNNTAIVAAGTLQLGNGGTSGTAGSGAVNNSGTLVYNRADGYTLPVLTSAAGSTLRIDNGTLTLSAGSTLAHVLLNGAPAVLDLSTLGATSFGATLGGFGTVSGATVTAGSGAILRPGGDGSAATAGAYGALNVADSLTMAAGSTNRFDFGSLGADVVNVAGNLTLDGDLLINLMAPLAGTTQTLFNYTGSLAGAYNSVSIPNSRLSAAVITPSAGVVAVDITGAVSNLVWAGTSAAWDLNATASWNGGAEKFYQGDHVLLDDTAAGNFTITQTGTLLPGSVTVNNSANNYAIGGGGKISGEAGIFKDGTATLSLNNANDFDGPVVISNGTVIAGNNAAFGSTVGATYILPGATFDVTGNRDHLGEWFYVGGAGVGGTGAVINASATDAQNPIEFMVLTGDTTFGGPRRWDLRDNGRGAVLTGGTNTLTKMGGSYVPLVGAAADVGEIVVQEGTFAMEAATTINTNFGITVNPGGTMNFWKLQYPMGRPITLNGGSIQANGSDGYHQNHLTGPIELAAGTTSTNIGGNTLMLDGELKGSGDLVKYGGANLWLNGSNTYSGTISVQTGSLTLNNPYALGNSVTTRIDSLVVGGGGAPIYLRGGNDYGAGKVLVMTSLASTNFRSSIQVNDGRTNYWSGTIVASGDGLIQPYSDNAGSAFIIAGPVTNDGAFTGAFFVRGGGYGEIRSVMNLGGGSFQKTDASTWLVVTNGHDFRQFALDSSGTLLMGADNVFSTGQVVFVAAATGTLASDSDAPRTVTNEVSVLATGEIKFGQATRGTGDLTFTGPVNLNSAARTIAVNNEHTTLAGEIRNGHITKTGTGTLFLLGANTTLTNLTVNAGSIALGHDDAAGIGTINMNSAIGGLSSADANARTVTNLMIISQSILFGRDGSGDLTFTTAANNGSAAKTLTVSNGLVRFSGGLTNTGNITKSGPGVLELGGPLGTTAALTINDGTLRMAAGSSFAGTTGFTVTMADSTLDVVGMGGWFPPVGQTLQGSGAVTGDVIFTTGSWVVPGLAGLTNALRFGNNLSFTSGASNLMDFAATAAEGGDRLDVGGALTLDGDFVVTPLSTLQTGAAYRAINFAGIVAGVLPNVTVPNTRYTGAADTNTPGQVNLTFSGAPSNLLWKGGTSTWDVNAAANWNDNVDTFYNADRTVFGNDGTNLTVTLTGTLAPGSIYVTGDSNYTFAGAGKLAGYGRLDKDGTGTLTISSANDAYHGVIDVSNGVLRVGSALALGSTEGATYIRDGATLDWGGIDVVNGERIQVQGAGASGTGAVINAGASGRNESVRMTLAGDTTLNSASRWDFNGNNLPASFDGGTFTLTKNGGQILAFKYVPGIQVGDIRIEEGDLRLEDTSTINDDYDIHVYPGATYSQWRLRTPMGRDLWFTNSTFYVGGANNATENVMRGTFHIEGDFTNRMDQLATIDGQITGGGRLVKIGGSTLYLTATNSDYAGGTLVSAGTLQLGTNGPGGWFGAGTDTVTNDGTIVVYRNNAQEIDRDIVGIGNFRIYNGIVTNSGRTLAHGGEFWVGQGTGVSASYVQNGGTLFASNWLSVSRQPRDFTSGAEFVLNGGEVIKMGGGNVIVGSLGGKGVLTVNGGTFLNNSMIAMAESETSGALYEGSGVLNLNGGLVQATQVAEYGANAGSSTVNFNGGVLQAVAGDGSSSTVQGQFMRVDHAYVLPGGAKIDTAGMTVTLGQPLEDDGAPGGGLTKLGAGTLTLNAKSTYNGNTVISNGTLRLLGEGMLPNTPVVHVGAGASLALPQEGYTMTSGQTLQGDGAVSGGLVMGSGSTLAPGPDSGPGTLTVSNNLTLRPGSFFDVRLWTAADYDRIAMLGGPLDLGGASLVLSDTAAFVVGTEFVILSDYGSLEPDRFAGLPNDGDTVSGGNNQYAIDYTGGTGNDITLTVIPEPSTLGMLGLTAAVLLLRRRRRG